MPTTTAHKFCDTQPTTSFALLRIQLIIPPMIYYRPFKPFSSLGGGSPPPPDAVAAPLPPGNNASTSTPMAIPISMCMETIVIPSSLNRVWIFSPNEVSLSNTLAIVSSKLVIWDFNLPFRRSIDSCLTFSSSFRSSIHFVMSSLIASS